MPKKYLIYIVGLILLALGFYGYSKWNEAREKVNLWTLVPEDAVFVVESGNNDRFIDRLKRTQVWESLSEIAYLRQMEENLALIDSLGGGRQNLYKFLGTKKMLTSVHVVGKTDFDLVYYLPVSTVKEHRFLRTLIENLEKNEVYNQENREYQGIQISTIRNSVNGEVISYFTYRNNLILSQSPLLLEEIIVKIQHGRFESAAADFSTVDYLKEKDVYANVLVNYHNLPPFLNLFFKPELKQDIEYLCGLGRNSMLGFKLDNNKLAFSGFSNPQTLSQSFYKQISGQAPQKFRLQQYLPDRTALLLHFGLENMQKLQNYKGKPAVLLDETEALLADSLRATFRGELALGYLKNIKPTAIPEKVVFAQTPDPAKTAALLKTLVSKRKPNIKTSTYREKVGSYYIQSLPVAEFPEVLFGHLFRGFSQTYFVALPDYVVFAPDATTLRTLLADITSGNVWANSKMQLAYLEEVRQESNFSLFVNSENAWEMLNRFVLDSRKESLLRNENLIKDFRQFSIQFSAGKKQLYTQVLLRQPDALAQNGQPTDTFAVERTVRLKSRVVAGPFPVRNPLNRSQEMVVQDSSLVLHCIAADGTVSWSDSLNEKICGKVVQAPFGSDGKTKYLFATTSRIHCLDRTGEEIENFPYYLPDTIQAQMLTVIDWDHKGNLKLLLSDESGDLYLFDEAGDLQEGWGPRVLGGRLAAPPQAIRVGVKNVLLALLENGYVYALDEAGNTYPGFPFSVRSGLRSGAFGHAGINLRKSEFTLATTKGEVVTFNLAGEILKRSQLPRPSRNATFELIPENSGKSYLIARQSEGRMTLFAPDFTLLLERNFFTSSRKIVQYFLFGGDKIVYAVTETGPHKTYLFDGKARPIGNSLLENQNPIQLFYNSTTNQYQLYKTFGSEFKKVTLKQ